ncbi:MAG: phosphotransferase [Bacteroidia bacterium]|nr:phosphotransferase [Bacteroidia bacterium]
MSFRLDAQQLPALQAWLEHRSLLLPGETVLAAAKPGEGNMNYTLRLHTNCRTLIIKQARPYVEKYPSIPAPQARALVEGQFYRMIQSDAELRAFTPAVLHADPEDYMLLLEDLGEGSDFTPIYQPGASLEAAELTDLLRFLSALHRLRPEAKLENRAMRELNAEHIFRYPFMEENGFSLDQVTPGLQAAAMEYKTDARLKAAVQDLSAVYLGDGPCLLHGDYYPGSWLRTASGVKVIDPEFGFTGPAEFDVAVMMAHMRMAAQPPEVLDRIRNTYQAPAGFSWRLARQLSGVEVMRRIIGLAQLPLSLDLQAKQDLLREAYTLILEE